LEKAIYYTWIISNFFISTRVNTQKRAFIMTSVFLDLDALDDDDVDEHMHDYAFVENSDDEDFIDDSYLQDAGDATLVPVMMKV